jgi:hypothetical protein
VCEWRLIVKGCHPRFNLFTTEQSSRGLHPTRPEPLGPVFLSSIERLQDCSTTNSTTQQCKRSWIFILDATSFD